MKSDERIFSGKLALGRHADGIHTVSVLVLPSEEAVECVNRALYLKRPLLITGERGTGKTTLASAVAYELNHKPYNWHLRSSSTVQEGLYRYDAVAHLHAAQLGYRESPRIEEFISFGPLAVFMIPLKLDRCEVPQRLSRWHWVEYFDPDGMKKLLTKLKKVEQSFYSQEQ